MTSATADPSNARCDRMPVLFVGHGSPMNAIQDNQWSQGFAALGALVPKPSAILAVSAHWFIPGIYLTGDLHPKTIHDFSGFPARLYEIDYPAPGRADLAARVRDLLGHDRASLSTDWGPDHGTWSVLRWMFPEADQSGVSVDAIDWLCRAFAFEVRLKVEGEGGRIEHSELEYGDGLIMVGSTGRHHRPERAFCASPRSAEGRNTQSLCIVVDDVKAHCERARAARATIYQEPEVHDYGEKYWADLTYEAVDPEGHHWFFMQRVREQGQGAE